MFNSKLNCLLQFIAYRVEFEQSSYLIRVVSDTLIREQRIAAGLPRDKNARKGRSISFYNSRVDASKCLLRVGLISRDCTRLE